MQLVKNKIDAIIYKAAWRIRLNRLSHYSMLALSMALVLAALGVLLHRAEIWPWSFYQTLLSAIAPLVLLAYAAFSRVSKLGIAQSIDSSQNLHEQLSSAYTFLQKSELNDWETAQVKHCATQVDAIDLAAAIPLTKPKYCGFGAVALLLFLTAIFTPLPSYSDIEIEQLVTVIHENIPEVKYRTNIDAGTAKLREEQIAELVRIAELSGDDEQIQAARELETLIKEDQENKVSPEEFAKRLKELTERFARTPALPPESQEKFDEHLREAAKSTPELQTEPETQELAEALKENDYDKAAKVLEDLLKQMEDGSLSSEKLQKLAKAFESLAEKLDPTDPQLKEAIKRNKSLLDTLNKKLESGAKLSQKEQKNLKDAEQKAKEMQEAESEAKNTAEGKALEKLQEAFNQSAQDMKNQAQAQEQGQEQEGQKQEQGQEQEAQKQGQEGQEGQKQGQEGQKQGQEGQKQGQEGQNQGQEGQNQGQEGQNQGQEGQNQGQEGQKQGQEGQKQGQDGQKQGQDGQKQGQEGQEGQDQSQSGANDAYEEVKSKANDRTAQENAKELEKLAKKIQEDAKRSEGDEQSSDAQQNERERAVEDFMKRAKGQEQGQEQSQNQPPDAQSGKDQGQGEGQGSEQATAAMPSSGENPGVGHSEGEGEETSLDANLQQSHVQGMKGDGPKSTSEIIEIVGQTGFANVEYRDVYQSYEEAAEEALEKDKVPQGYRHYIERYFDYIRPQN
ncbi:MAG: hypothetical protein ACOX8U_08610 [Bradymonadia bacterium]